MRYVLFIILGGFFKWASKHPKIADKIPKSFFRWSLNTIPNDLRSDPRVKTAALAGMQEYVEHYLDEHPEKQEATVDEMMEQILKEKNWETAKDMWGVTDSDAREVISNALFLVKHRAEYKQKER